MTTVDEVRTAALQLSRGDQLQLIQELLRGMQDSYQQSGGAIPSTVRRTPPITDLADLAADFWPEDESADAINAFIAQERSADRMSDRSLLREADVVDCPVALPP
ncbi:hypothetical protein [Candidatus Viridilinea mediisalina]|uniref:Uncharacterized protein n=1 Tax=Candidatus Viridilinea mediisalina TaxID=2024553 RepID=A0A2A6RPN7_9CHLR|nr:hypothetical protein [Candidatus Viridilinea mediisalina]PDW04838.1 hypothetical protein CJ255_01115 [Candidatus Viridilinea mediisalina]